MAEKVCLYSYITPIKVENLCLRPITSRDELGDFQFAEAKLGGKRYQDPFTVTQITTYPLQGMVSLLSLVYNVHDHWSLTN